jgi:hypothetical protein
VKAEQKYRMQRGRKGYAKGAKENQKNAKIYEELLE